MTKSVVTPSYVFGVVSAGAQLPEVDETGPAEGLRLVEADGLAAVVGSPSSDRPLGRSADLLAHDRVLKAIVDAGTTVLPMRFGALLADEATVIEDVLIARHDELRAQLDRIDGRVQFTLTVHYEQALVLREVLAEHPDIARLRDSDSVDGAVTFERRVHLGELVVRALEGKASADARTVLAAMPDTVEVQIHERASPEIVLKAAMLVDHGRTAAFERAVEAVAHQHHPRLRMRLVGPSPAYDFVGGR